MVVVLREPGVAPCVVGLLFPLFRFGIVPETALAIAFRLGLIIFRAHEAGEIALSHVVFSHVKRLGNSHAMLFFVILPLIFAFRRTHQEFARGHQLHFHSQRVGERFFLWLAFQWLGLFLSP